MMHLFYRKLGAGTPLIVLHGVFGSSDNWLTLGKQLADHYEVFLIDQRNHGLSPRSPFFDYDVLSEDLRNFIMHHRLKNPIIVGHSMGGKVAMNFALKHPAMLCSLVVVDIAPRAYPPHHQAILKGLNAIPLDKISTRKEAEDILAEYVPDTAIRQFLLKNLARKEDGQFEWRINLTVIEQQMPAILGQIDAATTFDKPTLFIGGSRSTYILPQDHADIRRLFPYAQIQFIEGAGHWVQAEKPKEFLAVLLDFLQQKS